LLNVRWYCLVNYLQNTSQPEATILDLEKIVAELKQEMERIGSAIGLLEQSEAPRKRRGRRPGAAAAAISISTSTSSSKPRRRGLTPAGRKRLSELMKKRWAERRKKQS